MYLLLVAERDVLVQTDVSAVPPISVHPAHLRNVFNMQYLKNHPVFRIEVQETNIVECARTLTWQ